MRPTRKRKKKRPDPRSFSRRRHAVLVVDLLAAGTQPMRSIGDVKVDADREFRLVGAPRIHDSAGSIGSCRSRTVSHAPVAPQTAINPMPISDAVSGTCENMIQPPSMAKAICA